MKARIKFDTDEKTVFARIVDADSDNALLEEFSFDLSAIPEKLEDGDGFRSLAAYGFLKLMQDRNSDLTEAKLSEMGIHGIDACRERVKAFQTVHELVLSGKWSERKRGAGRGTSIDTILAEAVARFMSEKSGQEISPAVATIKLQGMDKNQVSALRKHETIKEYMDEARAAARKAAEDLDLSDLF